VGTITGVTQSTGTIIGGTESLAMINVIKPDAKSVGAGLLANAVGQLPLKAQADCFRGQARSHWLRCSS
jgi:cellulase/cellobiase CelA1